MEKIYLDIAFIRLNLGINELFDLFDRVYQQMPAQIGSNVNSG